TPALDQHGEKVTRAMRRRSTLALLALLTLGAMAGARPAAAAEPAEIAADGETADEAWRTRYGAARAQMLEGKWHEAETELRALASSAKNDGDRRLAEEMADLAASHAARQGAIVAKLKTAREDATVRTSDELKLLYASSFL